MEVPSESFHRSSWDSRTCYPRRAFNQELTDELAGTGQRRETINARQISLSNVWAGIRFLLLQVYRSRLVFDIKFVIDEPGHYEVENQPVTSPPEAVFRPV